MSSAAQEASNAIEAAEQSNEPKIGSQRNRDIIPGVGGERATVQQHRRRSLSTPIEDVDIGSTRSAETP